MQSGDRDVTRLEADAGGLEGEAVNNGQKIEFHAGRKTGAITARKPDS
jgi:hypothetical protein